MDYRLLIVSIIVLMLVVIYDLFFATTSYDFFQNMLPELIGLLVTYEIIEYLITKRREKIDQRRLINLYHQIRREMFTIIQNLRQISNYIEYVDENFYRWARDNKNSVKILYPLLIAGNDLFSEYFYATLFRVIRDVERMMDHILEVYPNTEITLMKNGDKNMVQHLHNELANFIMTCEYEESSENIELID